MGKLFNKALEVKTDLQLAKKIDVKDIKFYLQEEYERANKREDYIEALEKKIADYKELQIKYDALLVVQENTTERVKRREDTIKSLKEKLKKEQEKNLKLKAKITEIRANAKRLVSKERSKISKPKGAK